MRTDLYGSSEAISEKINQTAASVDSPKKREVPKIISNVQLVPSRPTPRREEHTHEDLDYCSDEEEWTEVKAKKHRKSVRLDMRGEKPMEVAMPAAANADRHVKSPPLPSSGMRRRVPRAAAVSIKANTDGLSYVDIIKLARENVNFKDLGITNPRMRRAANDGVIIEISDPEGAIKVDTLAFRLRKVIGESAAV